VGVRGERVMSLFGLLLRGAVGVNVLPPKCAGGEGEK
jgi:hypothetical protein